MRTPRVFLLIILALASLTLLIISLPSSPKPIEHTEKQTNAEDNGMLGTFSFSAPLSLFPPNAIISLTDDNTTSFLARPAAFGPPLPSTGLSGQLWVGNGFGDDTLRHGIISAGSEGELGCSDVTGDRNSVTARPLIKGSLLTSTTPHSKQRRDTTSSATSDDGTDEPVGDPGSDSPSIKRMDSGWPLKHSIYSGANHADIQFLQESAEIAGKVVMLSRGGCGFLEKVEWAQRRGGIAVIVADDTRGGPLIQMYARGDTSNVTIPSVFTSHTTAHLLSSLIPPGTYVEDAAGANGGSVLKVKRPRKSKQKENKGSKQRVPRKRSTRSVPKGYTISSTKPSEHSKSQSRRESWLGRLLWASKPSHPSKKKILDWVIVDEWDDNEAPEGVATVARKVSAEGTSSKNKISSKSTDNGLSDGVKDWRDPEFINRARTDKPKIPKAAPNSLGKVKDESSVERYYTPSADVDETKSNPESASTGTSALFSKLLSDNGGTEDEDDEDDGSDDNDRHEGLWVTLTQTSGATPFFDTLLVLVVSPLITLTVVYALLLVRSRIRQRRWRAPKSVVDRLPVRTYQTVPITSTNQSRQPTPTSSSPATPLLQESPSRPHPRSRATSGLPEPASVSRANSDGLEAPKPRRSNEREKKGDWKKYMGRQIECVVCLEEYVDGVSRVMSLPCGHEFHVECITPWLTTRRRTCPICKGDVVRSLARGGSSSPRYEPYRDDSDDEDEDDVQDQAANALNVSPSADRPVSPGSIPVDADVERGIASPVASQTRSPNTSGSWFADIAARLGITSSPPAEEDRTR